MDFYDFLYNISKCSKEDIFRFIPDLKEFLCDKPFFVIETYLNEILEKVDTNEFLIEWFKDEEKFDFYDKELDIPNKLQFGIEIEVASLHIDTIKNIFSTNQIAIIMRLLEIPDNIANKIIRNVEFDRKNDPSKWIFAKEGHNSSRESEASSPILSNTLEDLNQISAVCTFFKALHATTHQATGIHINIGANYLECNEKAVENLLKIWAECEELLFKIANKERETMRTDAIDMASPIKANIQEFFENDGSILLNTEEVMDNFLYQIQAKRRLDDIVSFTGLPQTYHFSYDLLLASNEQERFNVFRNYNNATKKENTNSKVRYTSINFNHMNWNIDDCGRIEIRIFNSSMEPKIIFENILLVGKIFEVSLKNAKDPNYKKSEFEQLFLHNVTETTKLNNLMNLLFDYEKQKSIFINRYSSIQGQGDYHRYISGKDTFIREGKSK